MFDVIVIKTTIHEAGSSLFYTNNKGLCHVVPLNKQIQVENTAYST